MEPSQVHTQSPQPVAVGDAGWDFSIMSQETRKLYEEAKIAAQDDSPGSTRGLQVAQHAFRNAYNLDRLNRGLAVEDQTPSSGKSQEEQSSKTNPG